MSEIGQYKYDLAISFLYDPDVHVAKEIYHKLKDYYSVFFSDARQLELAGTDGVESFSNVFSGESRFCLVLHRKNWGTSGFTKIEEFAIRNRILQGDHNYCKLLKMNSIDKPPSWFPFQNIWMSYEDYPIDFWIKSIDLRLKELSAKPREITPAMKARQAFETAQWKRDHDNYRNSQEGANAVEEEYQKFLEYFSKESASITEQNPNYIFKLEGSHYRRQSLTFGSRKIEIFLDKMASNILTDDTGIGVRWVERYPFDGNKKVAEFLYKFDLCQKRGRIWSYNNHKRTSKELASKILLMLIAWIAEEKYPSEGSNGPGLHIF